MMKHIRAVTVFGGTATPNEISGPMAEPAKKLGQLLATAKYEVMFGGCNTGLLQNFAQSYTDAGGELASIYPLLIGRASARFTNASHNYVTSSVAEQREMMRALSKAAIALPGSINTMAEILELASHNDMLRINHPNQTINPIILLNTNGYYESLRSMFNTSCTEGMTKETQMAQFHFAATPEAVMEQLKALNAKPLPRASSLKPKI